MNDTFIPLSMRPERWPTYWIMPGQPFGLPSSALPNNRETNRERAFSEHGATTDLLNGALDASAPAWLRSPRVGHTNGGILGSLTRANGLLNLSPLGSSQSAVPFGANGGILAPLAMSMTTSPPRSNGDLETRQAQSDANVGSFVAPAEPTDQRQPIHHLAQRAACSFSPRRLAKYRCMDPTVHTRALGPRRLHRLHRRTFGRGSSKPYRTRIFVITQALDFLNLSTSWRDSCRYCLAPAPCNQCRRAHRPEKILRLETTPVRQPT
jgi:hypothetical protein